MRAELGKQVTQRGIPGDAIDCSLALKYDLFGCVPEPNYMDIDAMLLYSLA